jgi:cytochrome b561
VTLPANEKYTRTAIVLHWVIGVAIIVNVALAWTFESLPEDYAQPVTNTHKTLGIVVLGLALMRLLWRFAHAPPAFSAAMPGWQQRFAKAVHVGLYILIIGLPLSGWIYDSAWEWASSYPINVFGLFEMPRLAPIVNLPADIKNPVDVWAGRLHHWFGYALYALFVAHFAGAIKGQWFDRHPTLARMGLRERGPA